MRTFYISLFALILITSCKKEDQVSIKPTLDGIEIGLDNSKIGTIGGDLHVEVQITAPEKIKTVRLTIHPEGEESHAEESHEWELDTVYTEFDGLLNAEFHKHIEISSEAEAGSYHLHFIVVDYAGNQVTYESDVTLVNAN